MAVRRVKTPLSFRAEPSIGPGAVRPTIAHQAVSLSWHHRRSRPRRLRVRGRSSALNFRAAWYGYHPMLIHTLVPAIEKMPDRNRRHRNQRQSRPTMLLRIGRGIVVADHDKQQGQREIIMVHAALLAVLAVDRIGHLPCTHRCDPLFLPADDHEEPIRTMIGPRRVGLPFQAMQFLRQRSRRDRIFLRIVEPAEKFPEVSVQRSSASFLMSFRCQANSQLP